jgi:hypothetical protein
MAKLPFMVSLATMDLNTKQRNIVEVIQYSLAWDQRD